MKLLYISTVDHIIHVMLPHLDAARARGWQVDIACHITRDPAISQAHCDTLYEVPLSRNPFHPRNLLAVWKLIKLIRKEKYDIVHCHNPSGGVYGRLAATLSGIKPLRVYTAHGFHFHPLGNRITNILFRAIESFAGRFLSDAVLVINQWDYEQAQKIMPPEHVYLTPGVGVSTDKFDPANVTEEQRQAIRNEFGVPEDGFLAVCIGEMIPRKGHDHAFGIFGQDTPANTVLVFVGEGPLREHLESEANKICAKQIKFAGFRRDIREILAACDVFLFPSLQEGLPCAVQEALAMEKPVICYGIRGCTDLVDESCGRVIDWIPSHMVMGAAFAGLCGMSAEERQAMGHSGREKMVEKYDRPKCVEAWLKIYDDLMPTSTHLTSPPGPLPQALASSLGKGETEKPSESPFPSEERVPGRGVGERLGGRGQ